MKSVTLQVRGMSRSNCAHSITDTLNSIGAACPPDLRDGRSASEYDESRVAPDAAEQRGYIANGQ
ncbi:copper resistance protein CopZ [Paenibacillus thermoaerophilus]|uniref:Copper resistance protein CopZ n=1 Tax=Paenibacillus thermoaerophilus TaxID=1215385 RepID=A0ABW2UZQ0_9BACL|nr:hypothetical protein [Paenibacillus thermoaerophilus]TMV18978.1 hypothetical protein FE781_00200 [Paenibacillus thermoaerophilus]